MSSADLTRLGPYEILATLGKGGMGTVYRARHAETGLQVALKVLPSTLAREEGFVERFRREIRTLSKLDHPNIVKLYEAGQEGETHYYAMEYVEGENLYDMLRRRHRLPWREAVEIGVQVCRALKHAHDSGVIHRDLKPSNLLLATNGKPDGLFQVKLTDFGVAQVFAGTRLTATGSIIGTAEFMSPEQAEGRRATKRSDLYSLGAVLYATVTGRAPFIGKTMVEVLQRHRYGQFDRPRAIVPDIPPWLDDIICQLLDKNPEKRPPDAYVLARRLEAVERKWELQADSATIAMAGSRRGGDDASATGVATGPGERGRGVGTLMKDLVRSELERLDRPHPIVRFLTSTWMLVLMLVLLVLGVWWLMQPPDAATLLADGRALMEDEGGPRWAEAREVFDELLERYPNSAEAELAESYLEEIADHERSAELRRALRMGRLGGAPPESEGERFFRRAVQQIEAGEIGEARGTLEHLIAVFAGQPDEERWVELARDQLALLDEQPAPPESRRAALDAALERADELRQQGEHAAARAVWEGIIALYGDEAAAAEHVQRARDALEREPR